MKDSLSDMASCDESQPQSLEGLGWRDANVALSFALGDLVLWRKRLGMHVCDYDPAWIIAHANGFTHSDVALLAERNGYDKTLFRSLPISQSPAGLIKTAHSLVYVTQTYRRCFVDLKLGVDRYTSHFSSKTRATIRRKIRKYTDACGGKLPWQEYRTSSELEAFYPLARTISEHTYQEALLHSGLPSSEEFRSRMLQDAAHGNARAYLLFDNEGRGLAYLYCPVNNGIVSYQYLGYVAGHPLNELSPGTILLWLALQRLQEEERYAWFDFTEGSDEKSTGQKSRFATADICCADFWVFQRTLRNVWLFGAHALVDRVSTSVGSALDRLGVKRAVKRWIRNRAVTHGN